MSIGPLPPWRPEARLHTAARAGDTAMLEAALDAGADPNRPDGRGFPPLILACYNDHQDAARLLLARGAAVDAGDAEGSTALAGAAFKGHLAIARLLLDAGASVDAANQAGRTPLIFAIMFGRPEMAALLVQNGADPHHTDAEHNSAADIARQGGRDDLLTALRITA